ncbi:hypothetical protein ACH4S8_42170 [Streptomyces sp. NPDC021080]|uniref:hypothetical protein n=1 Tax=Streptomyces sp. NPDC021080 TaxID=3365110 RepID=UPI0037879000
MAADCLTWGIPCTCTLAHLLARIDGDTLDQAALGTWLGGTLLPFDRITDVVKAAFVLHRAST